MIGRRLLHLMAFAILSARLAGAQNIDMSTVPQRDSVQLTIYNGVDLTLVRETREVTLRKGDNQLQFSWANTRIDPTSVGLEFPGHMGDAEVVDARFPDDRPQTLYWTIHAESDLALSARITYFTSGISWAADYVAFADSAEQSLQFDGFVTITNNSGEDYENASVRMVVGTINLVETIEELAKGGNDKLQFPWQSRRFGVAEDGLTGLDVDGQSAGGVSLGFAKAVDNLEAKQIVKEGLSEYFLFAVPGEETVRNGWSKRMRLFAPDEGKKVPFRIEYRYRPQEYGEELVRMFLVRNDTASTLGTSPLPDGRGAALPAHLRRRPERPGVPPDEVRPDRPGVRVQPRPRPAGDSRAAGDGALPRRVLVPARETTRSSSARPRATGSTRATRWRAGTTTRSASSGSATTGTNRSRWRGASASTATCVS
jgi:hypothetical protein